MSQPKGCISWNKGLKIGYCWNKGIPRTKIEKKHISDGISLKSRKRNSERVKTDWEKGKYSFMYGELNPSKRPEVKQKLAPFRSINAKKGITLESRKRISEAMKGKSHPMSEHAKKLHSERMKINNPMFKKEVLKKHPIFKSGCYFYSIGEKQTSKILKQLGIKFKHQYIVKGPNKKCYVLDFYLPNYNICIEFDGHESHRNNLNKDKKRDSFLLDKYNIKTLRIIPQDLNVLNREETIVKITNFVRGNFKFVKIRKITRIKKLTKVYDVKVKGNENFFLENKLVHNCPFRCQYCYADSFRASLYTSFFDNSKSLGLRVCKPDYYRAELEKLMKYRDTYNKGNEIQRAIGMEIPIRLGIRFEDFHPIERKIGVSLDFLKALAEYSYPVMVNTKSDLIGQETYVRALVDNKGHSAVHITMISADEILLKKLEPGAPSFQKRVQAAKNLVDAGVRIVARIEPLMVFVNDNREKVEEWIKAVKEAGVKNITLDTYSWSATAPGIRRQMEVIGVDFDRMFLLMADSQWLGSLLLGKFMDYLREQGFSCSTFDFGNVPSNDQSICCEVGDWFNGFSFGNTVMAIRFIAQNESWVSWDMFNEFVEAAGGWLSDALKQEVFEAWNLLGNAAYFPDWAQGLESYGMDRYGRKIWRYNKTDDFRKEMLKELIRCL